MEKKSLSLFSLVVLLASQATECSSFKDFDAKNLKLNKEQYKRGRKPGRHSMSASVLMPKQAEAFVAKNSLEIAHVSVQSDESNQSNACSSAAAAVPTISTKVPFTGYWTTRYRPLSYASNIGYVPTYQRALVEAQGLDNEKEEWQDSDANKEFLTQAMTSFKKHDKPKELHEFLVLCWRKKITLPQLPETKTWLQETMKNKTTEPQQQAERKMYQGCLGMIGTILKEAKK